MTHTEERWLGGFDTDRTYGGQEGQKGRVSNLFKELV